MGNSHTNLLLRYHWAYCYQTLAEWSVDGPQTIQWLFHQNLVLIEQMISDKKICMGISHRILYWITFGCGDHLGRWSEMPDTIFEGGHPRIISAKFGWYWLSSFRGENVLVLSYLDDSVNKHCIYYGTYKLKMFEWLVTICMFMSMTRCI
jgi:hypothetical protein